MLAAVLLAAHSRAAGPFDVTKFGAAGDNHTDDTAAIRAATAALEAAGGGTLLFPARKTFLTGPFNISSHTEVVIESGATVLGHAAADWPIVDPRRVWPQCAPCFLPPTDSDPPTTATHAQTPTAQTPTHRHPRTDTHCPLTPLHCTGTGTAATASP